MYYKVINVYKGAATRFIDLLNLETGTQEKVFDDSAVVSNDNFEFMDKGGVYNCKIKLLDGFVSQKSKTSVELKILDTNTVIGNTKYWKVALENDIYYVPISQTKGVNLNGSLYYDILRKDLIQVDDLVHADCLSS